MRILLLFLGFLLLNPLCGQDIISKFPLMKDGKNVIDIHYAHFIPKTDKNNSQLFVIDDYDIGAVEFDDSFKVISTISNELRRKEFLDFSGTYSAGKSSYLYFTERNGDRFNIAIFNFIDNTFQLIPLDFKFKGELKLGTFIYDNSFMLLTIVKRSSILKTYQFKGKEIVNTRELDFSEYQKKFDPNSSLYDYMATGIYNNEIRIKTISQNSRSTLESTSFVNKLYQL